VSLDPALGEAVSGTTLYTAKDSSLSTSSPSIRGLRGSADTVIEVTGETTLEAGFRLQAELGQTASTCLLNFASAKNPGGGFEGGAQAQEESLARSSGLYACLRNHIDDFYGPHRKDPQDGLYSHAMLFSPQVPFFRDDSGALCPLWCASVITSPAPNAGVALRKRSRQELLGALRERCGRILRLAAGRGQSDLVLGAFGCGVFQNDPRDVAAAFHHWLVESGEFAGMFRRIVFAVPGADANRDAFEATFGRDPARKAASSPDAHRASTTRGRPQRWGRSRKDAARDKASPCEETFGPAPPLPERGSAGPQPFELFVVLDFEATCEKSGQIHPQEIIEFPMVLVDAVSLQVEDEFRTYVRPVHHPRLTEFCTELTGITQDLVAAAPEFPEAMRRACSWLQERRGERRALFVTCGDWDLLTMLPAQCQHSGQKVPLPFRKWANLKKVFATIDGGRKVPGMAGMLSKLGLQLEGRHHSGLDDCRNIARILQTLCRDGASVDITSSSEGE